MKDYRVLIGTYGWQHAQWQGGFYPEDLPADWQLAYYSNEFPVVLLPAAYWQQAGVDVVGWLTESNDTLRFIVEWPEHWQTPLLIEQGYTLLKQFGARLLGVLVPLVAQTATVLQPVIEQLLRDYRVCVDYGMDLPALPVTLSSQVNAEQVSVCWHGTGDGKILQRGSLALARIDCKELTLRGIRQVLEACLAAQAPQRYLVVIFEGEPPPVILMEKATVMLDML